MPGRDPPAVSDRCVDALTRVEVMRRARWQLAFASNRKDHRFYEIVEDTIRQGFEYGYFAIRDDGGEVRAIAPFFVLDQDMLAGVGAHARAVVALLRRPWPRFMFVRTLMVGCVAGEGHLDDPDEMPRAEQARRLAAALPHHAAKFGARMIVFKEFPALYRPDLAGLAAAGYTRVPSFPMTRLNIGFPSFDDFMARTLSHKTRQDLRVKFRAAAAAAPIELRVVVDITTEADDVCRLYLQVFHRSKFRFEELTREFFCRLGPAIPDKVRFFVWRQHGRVVAFSLCMIQGDEIFAEYLGLDYALALDLHLYHYAFRDVVNWAIGHGCKTFRSSGLGYDPKLHLRALLDPIDLYVLHVSKIANVVLARLLPLIEPTRYDPILRRFPNYDELWGRD